MQIDLLMGAGIAAAFAYIVIFTGILRGQTRMNIATWLVWSIVNTVVTAAIIKSGFSHPWMNITFMIGSIVTLLLSLRRGNWSWGKIETICSIIALVAMVCWFYFGPTQALVLGVTAMFVGGVPQLIDTYHRPGDQQSWTWFLFLTSCTLSLMGAPTWDLAHVLYPIFGLVMNGFMFLFILLRPKSAAPRSRY
ncbi:MAG: hypothetical protein AAB472_02595 [Patescibacteria group bacterium]